MKCAICFLKRHYFVLNSTQPWLYLVVFCIGLLLAINVTGQTNIHKMTPEERQQYLKEQEALFKKEDVIYKKRFFEEVAPKAAFIFEGEALDYRHYQGEDGRYYYSNLMKIHKVFKGNLIPGTVEIIVEHKLYGKTPQVGDTIVGPYKKGKVDLFFCQPQQAPKSDFKEQTTNTIQLEFMTKIRYHLGYNTISCGLFCDENNAAFGMYYNPEIDKKAKFFSFKTIEEVYEQLMNMSNIECQDLTFQTFKKYDRREWRIKKYNERMKGNSSDTLNYIFPTLPTLSVGEQAAMLKTIEEKYAKAVKHNGLYKSGLDNTLTYTFENATYTEDATDVYLEFDVFIQMVLWYLMFMKMY